MRKSYYIRQDAWYKDRLVEFQFPDNWNIQEFKPNTPPKIDTEQIRLKIIKSDAGENICDLYKIGMKVLLICDDTTRPTRTDVLLPVLLEILHNIGMKREDVSILSAPGTHAIMPPYETKLKYGQKIIDKYKIYYHHSLKRNVYLGRTSMGTPVYVNKLLTQNDLIICIGGIYPHSPAGFGGGGKMLLGVSGIKTILHFHSLRKGSKHRGDVDNDLRKDVEEAARIAGINYIINNFLNEDREIVDIVTGDMIKAYEIGVQKAKKYYSQPSPKMKDFDLVMADPYPFDTSFAFARKGWWPITACSPKAKRLMIASMPNGIEDHFIFSVLKTKSINRRVKVFYYNIIAFGIWNIFLKNVKKLKRRKVKNTKLNSNNSSLQLQSAGTSDFSILHNCSKVEELKPLGYNLFDDQNTCFRYLNDQVNKDIVKVALYRASSLTYEDYSS